MLTKYYDESEYPFRNVVTNLFNVKSLESLHTGLEKEYKAREGVAGLGNDTHSFYHELFYDKLRAGWPEFTKTYVGFVKNVLKKEFKEEKRLIYQTLPSFRIQYPNAKAVTTIHCDSDIHHKHPIGELNILIPLTDMKESSAVWMESLPNLADWHAMNLSRGEYLLWNGNRCRHYNKTNITNTTRVSLDFRVLPETCYNPEYDKKTATTKQRFIIGEYYSEI
jgi:hypothetical protein